MISDKYQDRLGTIAFRVYMKLKSTYDGTAPEFHDVRDRAYRWFEITLGAKETVKSSLGLGTVNDSDTESIFRNMEPLLERHYISKISAGQ